MHDFSVVCTSKVNAFCVSRLIVLVVKMKFLVTSYAGDFTIVVLDVYCQVFK